MQFQQIDIKDANNGLASWWQGDYGNWPRSITPKVGLKVDHLMSVASVMDPAGDWPAFAQSFVLLFCPVGTLPLFPLAYLPTFSLFSALYIACWCLTSLPHWRLVSLCLGSPGTLLSPSKYPACSCHSIFYCPLFFKFCHLAVEKSRSLMHTHSNCWIFGA